MHVLLEKLISCVILVLDTDNGRSLNEGDRYDVDYLNYTIQRWVTFSVTAPIKPHI